MDVKRWWWKGITTQNTASRTHLLELVDTLASVVSMHVGVGRPKMPPLEPIHRPQIPFLPVREAHLVQELPGWVSVPDVDVLFLQLLGVGGAADEPEQLLSHATPEHTLGGQQWEDAWRGDESNDFRRRKRFTLNWIHIKNKNNRLEWGGKKKNERASH